MSPPSSSIKKLSLSGCGLSLENRPFMTGFHKNTTLFGNDRPIVMMLNSASTFHSATQPLLEPRQFTLVASTITTTVYSHAAGTMMLIISHTAIAKVGCCRQQQCGKSQSANFKLFQARPQLLEKRRHKRPPPAAAAAATTSLHLSQDGGGSDNDNSSNSNPTVAESSSSSSSSTTTTLVRRPKKAPTFVVA
jgi:hypothetical protein